jgi:hypothetical protein
MPSSAKFHPGSRIQIEFSGFTTLRGDTMLRAKLSCLLRSGLTDFVVHGTDSRRSNLATMPRDVHLQLSARGIALIVSVFGNPLGILVSFATTFGAGIPKQLSA